MEDYKKAKQSRYTPLVVQGGKGRVPCTHSRPWH